MARITVRANRAGIKELLHHPGIRAEMHRLGGRVAQASGIPGVSVEVVDSGGYRSVARVVDDRPGALEHEAAHGALTRALDSA